MAKHLLPTSGGKSLRQFCEAYGISDRNGNAWRPPATFHAWRGLHLTNPSSGRSTNKSGSTLGPTRRRKPHHSRLMTQR